MSKFKVLVTRYIPETGLKMMESLADLIIWPGEIPPPYEVLLEKIAGVDGLVSLLTDPIDIEVLKAARPNLKVISQYAVGVDNIDLGAATLQGIPVGNTPGVLTETTADFAWALMMAAGRRVLEGDRFTRAGLWKTWGPLSFLGSDIFGATLGIVGFGRIGQAMARRAKGFNMKIIYSDPQRQPEAEISTGAGFVPFEMLLKEADFITIHANLTKENYHLIGDDQFRLMKPTAVLVNTSRGPIVDPDALYRALESRRIAGAGLDVTEPEPIPVHSPLLELDNLIVAPHIASASIQSRTRMSIMTAENLLAGLKGERLPYCVNPEVYGKNL